MRVRATLLAVLVLLAGCPESHPKYTSFDEAKAAALAGREAARAARDTRDPAAALAAAARAEDALKQAEALAPPRPETPATDAPAPADPLQEARRAAREARLLGQETDERARLEAQLSGLKASAYREVRAVALTGTFKGLALAAREADARGLDALPQPVRDAALQAAGWAGRPPKADGTPDWKAIAGDMDALAATPPRAIGVTLALGFFALGKTGLALFETEALDPAAITDPRERLALHLLRGLVRNGNGYRRLAVLEVEGGLASSGLAGEQDVAAGAGLPVQVTGAEVLGGAHLALGAFYLHQKDYAAADREVALALRAWPDNPVGEFLTGERLLATGEREKAAASLEAAAKGQGQDAEWLAGKLATRARAVRDGTADPDDGLLADPAFLAELALRALWKAAERSPQAAAVKAEVERARQLCSDMLGRLPGMGEGEVAPVTSR